MRDAQAFELREQAVGTFNDRDRMRYCVKKWQKLVEGIGDPYVQRIMAVLAENQYQHLSRLTEETRASNVGSFTKYIFPILRRVVPNLIAPHLISTQPMMAPVGGTFIREAKFGTAKGKIAKNANVFQAFEESYSSERVVGELLATGDGSKYGGAGAALAVTLAFSPVRPLSSEYDFVVTITEETTAGDLVQTATDDGNGALTEGDGAAGAIDYATGAITGFKFTDAVGNGNKVFASYQYDMEMNSKVPEINLDITLTPIVARPRKLKGTWSPEASEDFRYLHGLDGEADLTTTMSQEMALEIDREIIVDLLGYSTQGTQGTYDRAVGANETEIGAIRRIMTALSDVSQMIHKKTRRGSANWIVTSPEIVSILNQLSSHADYAPSFNQGLIPNTSMAGAAVQPPSYGPTQSDFGVVEVGVLNNRWRIYQDPMFNKDKVLMGLKGRSYLDAGYVWAPYIMMVMTPTFYDPSDFSFRKGIRSRYAKQRLRPEFYGAVTVSNLTAPA